MSVSRSRKTLDEDNSGLRSNIDGWAYPALSSKKLPVKLMIRPATFGSDQTDDGLHLDIVDQDGTVLTGAALSNIQIDPPLGKTARRMTFPDGTLFETDNHSGIEALTGKTKGSILHEMEQFRPRLIAFTAACVFSIWILWRYGVDIIVAAAVAITPPVITEQIDRGTLQTIDFTMADESRLNADDKEKTRKIFNTLLANMDSEQREDANFNLLFRDMPGVGPNAFALPGGTVIVTDDFVREFGDKDILAGVLGHEIGHVVEQHGLKQTYRSLSIFVLIAFLAGDTGPIIEDLVLEGNLLLSLSFSRHHESSADRFGLSLSNKSGYDPAGLKVFFEELSKLYGDGPQWLSTHPTNDERVKNIDAYITTLE